MQYPFLKSESVVAKAGGGQSITQTAASDCDTTFVSGVTAGDSVTMGPALAARKHLIVNSGAVSINVFGPVGSAIGAGSVNAAVAIAARTGLRLIGSPTGGA
jgi:hypothetical protein